MQEELSAQLKQLFFLCNVRSMRFRIVVVKKNSFQLIKLGFFLNYCTQIVKLLIVLVDIKLLTLWQ